MSSSAQPRPRLCHVTKWPHFDGYGFNLHAEKRRQGQFIGKVDEGSPAEAAGLRFGDRIVEVNGVNISHENHKQVVQRIKAVPDEARLLVLDAEADAFFREADVVVTGSNADVVFISSDSSNNTDTIGSSGSTKVEVTAEVNHVTEKMNEVEIVKGTKRLNSSGSSNSNASSGVVVGSSNRTSSQSHNHTNMDDEDRRSVGSVNSHASSTEKVGINSLQLKSPHFEILPCKVRVFKESKRHE